MHGTCFKIMVKVGSAHAMQARWGGDVGKFLLVLKHGSRHRQAVGFTHCVVQVLNQAFGHTRSPSSHILYERLIQLFRLSKGFFFMQCRKKNVTSCVQRDKNKYFNFRNCCGILFTRLMEKGQFKGLSVTV